MAHVNSFQEQIELEKLKPKIRKAKIEQNKYEKKRIFVSKLNSFGNQRVLTTPCPDCNSVKVVQIDLEFECQDCGCIYYFNKKKGAIKV